MNKGPTWFQTILIAAVLCMGFYIYQKETGVDSKDITANSRTPDENVVRLGMESMNAAKLAPYNALREASNIDLSSTAEYARFIHEKLNDGYNVAWAKWADEMKSRFGETSDEKMSPVKQRELRDYLGDFADGVKKAK